MRRRLLKMLQGKDVWGKSRRGEKEKRGRRGGKEKREKRRRRK